MAYVFNDDIVYENFEALTNLEGIDEMFISHDAAYKAEQLLKFSECGNSKDVRAIRNSVVRIFAEVTSKIREEFLENLKDSSMSIAVKEVLSKDLWKVFDKYHRVSSALVSVCDNYMWKKFHTL